MGTPCGWAVSGCPCGDDTWAGYSADVRSYAESVAAAIVWAGTGRRYGQCELTVEPCVRLADEPLYVTYPVTGSPWAAYVESGQWYNACQPDTCSCAGRCEVALEGPTSTADVSAVTVAGVLVDPSAYVVYDGYLLTRIDGECWPTCRDYSNPDTAFTVTYLRGDPIPDHVQQALNRLACELAKSCTGGDCALPQRVRSLSRQGVDIEFGDLVDADGRVSTGLADVDRVIAAENPHGLSQRPVVLSPDLPAPRWVT